MATTWLTNLNLAQNQLWNAVLQTISSPPSGPLAGQVYYDTAKNQLGVYCGSAAGWVYLAAAGTGTVTTVSVATANGFQGSVANAGTTPAITIGTSISSGLLKAGGSNTIVAATSGTDYAPATTGSSILKASSGGFANAVAGTDYLAPTGSGASLTGITVSQVSGAAALASPTFTGTPAAPTATSGTNTTQIATTAFVASAVSAATSGLDPKPSADALAASNITLSGTQTVDGVALTAGMRCLAIAQSTASQNGLWVVASGAWSRPADFASASVQNGAFALVQSGTAYSGSGWVLSGTGNVTVDTTSETWVQFAAAQQLSAGTGITISANTVSINSSTTLSNNTTGTAANVTGTVAIANGGTGQTTAQAAINALTGTQTANTFLRSNGTNATLQALQYNDVPTNALASGGLASGLSTYSQKIAVVYTTALSNPNATTWNVIHNLNNSYPDVSVYQGTSSQEAVMCDVTVVSANEVTLGFAVAPTASTLSCTVVG
jgi:hypothetical protein